MNDLHAIVLAAGGSRRYGSPKQLSSWNGGTLLQHAVAQAQAACQTVVTVVLGAHADEVGAVLPDRGVNPVINNGWREGLASSIRAGVAALPADAGAALFLLCDQPLVSRLTLSALVERWRRSPASVVAARYRGTYGVPAVFPRSTFEALLALQGDRGAKPLFETYADRLESIPAPEAAIDIDTPDDLQILSAERDIHGVHHDHPHH